LIVKKQHDLFSPMGGVEETRFNRALSALMFSYVFVKESYPFGGAFVVLVNFAVLFISANDRKILHIYVPASRAHFIWFLFL